MSKVVSKDKDLLGRLKNKLSSIGLIEALALCCIWVIVVFMPSLASLISLPAIVVNIFEAINLLFAIILLIVEILLMM